MGVKKKMFGVCRAAPALNPEGLPAHRRQRRRKGRATVSAVEVWLVLLEEERERRGRGGEAEMPLLDPLGVGAERSKKGTWV